MIELAKISEQEKNQRAFKIKKRLLKQTNNEELAETFKPMTTKSEKLSKTTKKLDPKILLFHTELPKNITVSDSLN